MKVENQTTRKKCLIDAYDNLIIFSRGTLRDGEIVINGDDGEPIFSILTDELPTFIRELEELAESTV